MELQLINGSEFNKKINEKKETCVVVFSKETCTVCKQLKPAIEKVADAYAADDTIHFYTMDVKTNDGLATFKSLQLMGVPQTVLFKDGEQKEALPGAMSEAIIRKEIENMINPKTGFMSKLKGLFK